MKKCFLFVFSLLLLGMAMAQQKALIIQQESGKLFLHHAVAPKENWYSIGRIYNASPKEMAPFNNTSIDKGLAIGQSLKIPLTTANFLQSGQPASDEVLIPLYHTVREKEGLYRIGQLYNKVSPEQIKSWNKLTSDEVSSGRSLIVGYLKVKKDLSPLAKGGQTVSPPPAVVKTETKPIDKPTGTEITPAEKKDIPPAKPAETKPPAKLDPPQNSTASNFGLGGAFKSLYDEQAKSGGSVQNISGKGAAFKSTSGWKDGKYYVLMNKVQPGIVVKISNAVNGKFVYAKVLGEIPPIKENEGLLVRISNAATTELLFDEGTYQVEITWKKQ
jgi:LysM repeat protein